MGCGTSKKHSSAENLDRVLVENKLEVNQNLEKNSQEDDFQILIQGKSPQKNKFDEISLPNYSLTKNTDKIVDDSITATKIINDSSAVMHKNNDSKEIFDVSLKNSNESKEIVELTSNNRSDIKANDVSINHTRSKSKLYLGKIEFEKHPHEFDFSFINEVNGEPNQTDLMTDQILKEMIEIN